MTRSDNANLLRRAAGHLTQTADGEISPFELDEIGVSLLATWFRRQADAIAAFAQIAGSERTDDLTETDTVALDLARVILPVGER